MIRRQRPRYVVVADLVKVALVLAFAAYALHILTAGHDDITGQPLPTPTVQAPEPSKAERMAADKDRCWQGGDDPLAELPGHAVVRFTNGPRLGEVVYTANPELVEAAFNEALTIAGYGDTLSQLIDPVALCI